MKRIIALGIALAVATTLTGCGAVSTAPQTGQTPTKLADTGSAQTEAPAEAETPSPAPTTTSLFGEPITNDRGNLVKKIGQLAGTGTVDDPDTITSTFAVTDIIVDRKCTSGFSEKPQNGHFVAVHLNVETTKELAHEEYPSVDFNAGLWQAYGANGKRVNDPLGNAYTCLADKEMLPSEIGPSQSVSGWLVFDVPTTHGALVLAPFAAVGWEWAF